MLGIDILPCNFWDRKIYLNLMEKYIIRYVRMTIYILWVKWHTIALITKLSIKIWASSSRIENYHWKVTNRPGTAFNNKPPLFAGRRGHVISSPCWYVKENNVSSYLVWSEDIWAFLNSFHYLWAGHRKLFLEMVGTLNSRSLDPWIPGNPGNQEY